MPLRSPSRRGVVFYRLFRRLRTVAATFRDDAFSKNFLKKFFLFFWFLKTRWAFFLGGMQKRSQNNRFFLFFENFLKSSDYSVPAVERALFSFIFFPLQLKFIFATPDKTPSSRRDQLTYFTQPKQPASASNPRRPLSTSQSNPPYFSQRSSRPFSAVKSPNPVKVSRKKFTILLPHRTSVNPYTSRKKR